MGHSPNVSRSGWVAHNALLAGAVSVGDLSSIWFAAVLRAEDEPIEIGTGSNVQDGAVIHTDPGRPATIGDGVSVGHRAVLHGCTIGDHVLVGMGAIVLNGARIGQGCLLAAGTVVLENSVVPPSSLVAGIPGRVKRGLTEAEHASIIFHARAYVGRLEHYRHSP